MTRIPPAPPPIQRRDLKQTSLSFSQDSLWFLQQLDPENTAYHTNYLIKFTGGIGRTFLEQALNELVRRHEPLRTVYPNQGGRPVQIIQPFKPFSLPFVDYSGLPESEQERAIHQFASEQSYQPFDLQRGPLVRYALLHQAQNVDYLYFCTHHINFDAWSWQVYISELMKLYEACHSGKEPVLPELQIQYADYATWQREWLSGETLTAYIEHWKNILSGDLPVLELPTDRPRLALQTFRGARYHFPLSKVLSSQMKGFCQTERITPFQVFLAAYALLLMRYTGQEDIIIGCPFANRSRTELEGLVGVFINTLPIRMNLQGNPTVREFLGQVRAVMLDAFTWQAGPFEALVSEISPQRDLSRMPVFQVVINMRNVPKWQESIQGLEMENVPLEEVSAAFDITLDFSDSGDHFNVSLLYNTDLFDQSTILRMVSHYQNILEEMLTRSNYALSELEMLSLDECQQILVEWNDTVTEYPREKCIYQLFEEQVELVPNSPAVIFGGQQLTYRELNARANQIAHYLQKLGAGPEVPVGLYLERSAELVVAILGILKSGSPYVPLDTLYPMERRAEIIRDSGMKILVTQDMLVTGEFASDLVLLRLDELGELQEAESDQNLLHMAKPENLAYIIYTSGSTGKPKGVEIIHSSLVNCLLSVKEIVGLSAGDLSLTVTAPTFDISAFELLNPLSMGATVVVASRQVMYDSFLLAKQIMELPLRWMFATPATWQMLLDAGWKGKPGLKILCGGEALPSGLANHLTQICGEIYNLYGPTEATIFCASACLAPGQPVTIGNPIANTRLYILDSYHRPVPIGVPGELFIGGDGLARCYHNRPELTAEKFIPDPFRREPGARLYKTGDLALWRPEGVVKFLGRMDDQVKLRGFRIELGEIETTIGQYPGIRQAIVVVREDRPGDKRLVAYIIPAFGATLDVDELRGFLREKLPAYMVPSTFVPMDAFPLTINGKINRKVLPMPEINISGNREYIAPHNQTEQTLEKIWMEVLGIPRVSVGDSFFDIGGNSLSALQVVARIRDAFEIAVPVRRIFAFPGLSDLAAQIDLELLYQKQNSGLQDEINDFEEFIL